MTEVRSSAPFYGALKITAQNQWSDPIALAKGERYAVSVWDISSMSMTVTVQRRLGASVADGAAIDDIAGWRDVDAYTAAAEEDGVAATDCEMRIGCATGDYTSGEAGARIAK